MQTMPSATKHTGSISTSPNLHDQSCSDTRCWIDNRFYRHPFTSVSWTWVSCLVTMHGTTKKEMFGCCKCTQQKQHGGNHDLNIVMCAGKAHASTCCKSSGHGSHSRQTFWPASVQYSCQHCIARVTGERKRVIDTDNCLFDWNTSRQPVTSWSDTPKIDSSTASVDSNSTTCWQTGTGH